MDILGILNLGEKIIDRVGDYFPTSEEKEKAKQEYTKELESLKSEWGQSFDKNVRFARKAFNHFGGEEIGKILEEQIRYEDQIDDMAKRRSISKDQLKKWLASSLR